MSSCFAQIVEKSLREPASTTESRRRKVNDHSVLNDVQLLVLTLDPDGKLIK